MKPETAGNAPPIDQCVRTIIEDVKSGIDAAWLENRIKARILSIVGLYKTSAASSQEAAPPMNDKAQRIADYFGVPVAFDAEPAPSPATKETPPISTPIDQLKLWAIRSRASRQAWLESYGVPISNEFAQFAEAIGTLIELAENLDAGAKSVVAAPQLENRSNKDYAIKHGEYLAKAATEFLKVSNERAEIGEESDSMEDLMNADEVLADHRSALESAVYEFRKRAKRALAGAAALPSAPEPTTRFKDYYGDRWVPTIQRAIKFMSDCELTEFTREKTLNCMTAFALEMAVASPPVPSKAKCDVCGQPVTLPHELCKECAGGGK